MTPNRFTAFLEEQKVPYEVLRHQKAYTAQEVAHAVHLSGKEVAKSVVVQADGKYVLVVMPAPHRVNLASLKHALNAKDVRLATEDEVRSLFPDCEIGAMPPFGNLYGLPVYVSRPLTEDQEIAFNAGTHTEAVKISYKDFQRLVNPTVVDFSESVDR
jgi:Ala-tRNA(Pro) deacylase